MTTFIERRKTQSAQPIETLLPKEARVIEYFRTHPGATWQQMAEALRMRPLAACRLAFSLTLLRWLIEEVPARGCTRFWAKEGL